MAGARERLLANSSGDGSTGPTWTSGDDLGRMSVEAMVERSTGEVRDLSSTGRLSLTGAGVIGHAADLDVAGRIATGWQRALHAVGASLEGHASLRGQLPFHITHRTQMLLSPTLLPGSLLLQISPKQSGLLEVAPDGQKALPGTDDTRPLADRASEHLIGLLSDAVTASVSVTAELAAEFREIGPRATVAVSELSQLLDRGNVALAVSWMEPGHATARTEITASQARWLHEFVAGKHLDAAELTLDAIVHTVSDIEKWTVEANGEVIKVTARELAPDVIRTVNVGDRIVLRVRVASRIRADDQTRTTYEALELVGKLDADAPAAEGVADLSDLD